MIKLFLTALLLLLATNANASFTFIGTKCAGASTPYQSVTTAALNTTGANFFKITVNYLHSIALGTMSDSVGGNTYNALTPKGAGLQTTQSYYVLNPFTGTSQTFTYTGAGVDAPSICVQAWGGVLSFDTQSGNATTTSSGTTVQPGSITSTVNPELYITSLGMSNTGTASINSSFTIPTGGQIAYASGDYFGTAMAYLIETTGSSAVNPTWTFGANNAQTADMQTYKGNPKGFDSGF